MELRRYVAILRRRWPLVLATLVVAIAAGYLTRSTGVTYRATTTIYVGNRQFGSGGAGEITNAENGAGVERVAKTFSVMLASEPVARDAVEQTGVARRPRDVVTRTAAAVIPGTTLIRLVYSDGEAEAAQRLANGLSDALVRRAQTYEPGQQASQGDTPLLPAYVFERADVPTAPVSPPSSRRLVVAAILGLLLGAGVVFGLESLDLRIRSAGEVERRTGLPVLGLVPVHRADLPGQPRR